MEFLRLFAQSILIEKLHHCRCVHGPAEFWKSAGPCQILVEVANAIEMARRLRGAETKWFRVFFIHTGSETVANLAIQDCYKFFLPMIQSVQSV